MIWFGGNIRLFLVKIGRKMVYKHALDGKKDFPDYENVHFI